MKPFKMYCWQCNWEGLSLDAKTNKDDIVDICFCPECHGIMEWERNSKPRTFQGIFHPPEHRVPAAIQDSVIEEIKNERHLQDEKWGVQDHPPEHWMVILMEEVGEAAQDLCGKTRRPESYREEMVQVAAVALAAIENYDRGTR